MASFRQQSLTAAQAAEELGLSISRFYSLSASYLRACALKKARIWIPGTSGGDHSATWPEAVTELLKKRLLCDPPSPAYSDGCRTLIQVSVGQHSDFSWTPFRFVSDSVPG